MCRTDWRTRALNYCGDRPTRSIDPSGLFSNNSTTVRGVTFFFEKCDSVLDYEKFERDEYTERAGGAEATRPEKFLYWMTHVGDRIWGETAVNKDTVLNRIAHPAFVAPERCSEPGKRRGTETVVTQYEIAQKADRSYEKDDTFTLDVSVSVPLYGGVGIGVDTPGDAPIPEGPGTVTITRVRNHYPAQTRIKVIRSEQCCSDGVWKPMCYEESEWSGYLSSPKVFYTEYIKTVTTEKQ